MVSDFKRDLVLEEPKYREFLSLSDDEIVGERKSLIPAPLTPARPPPRHLPPSPPVPPPSARIPVPAPLSPSRAGIMPSSPLTGVPAALAALEAARIAKKYDFDLLYIVNLWPNRVAHVHNRCISAASSSPSSPPTSPTSSISPAPWLSDSSSLATPRGSVHAPSDHGICLDGTIACTGKNSGMTSRLLTGYGLAQLQHPFRLSATIHKKFLRADGWVEFRQDDAKPEEFARGYACSFYTGHSSDARCPGSATEQHSMQHTHANSTQSAGKTGQKKRRNNNRGIVFAAYRKARNDGGSICSGAAELTALHRDAETLVELLLDFHHVQRPQRDFEMVRRASEGSVPAQAGL
ncbi:hypothetical protein UCRPA7_4028 [Phaeoacremonium minimum UCRPA7]|uniref:Uncharacterized protein n=1 Tax=Phaeoacremonium minimum (strain UCR-PA7) TaxID=1286976 RepID=R8BMC8_PHAM7|nr:hypothetical protein UCRPA7_4028 [Phaeoacremonium minimum UCRPA7]EOO00482.1 hypothetical protein UCRPA7_4028 [Phaeoacremonium minimum UCRPA7]